MQTEPEDETFQIYATEKSPFCHLINYP